MNNVYLGYNQSPTQVKDKVVTARDQPLTAPMLYGPQLSRRTSDIFDAKINASDLFFRFVPIDSARFNKNFQYELVIWDAKNRKEKANYVFPLNPQNISVNVPAANVLEATMKGVYEANNGAPLRPISISGTTGTNPGNPKVKIASPPGDTQRALEYAFQNTIKSSLAVAQSASRTLHAFSPEEKFVGPLNYIDDSDLTTGYEHIHDLERFLDYYLAGKKLAENKGWRLYFLMHKDTKYYACSLTNYSIVKSAGTTEYQYSINMIAYRRDDAPPTDRQIGTDDLPSSRSISNKLSNILNGLRQARNTIALSHRVLAGIRSDINDSFIRPLGEALLMVKDLQGLAKDMSDFTFSNSTVKAMQESFKQYFTDNKSSLQNVAAAVQDLGLVGGLTALGKAQSAMNTTATEKLSSGQAEQFQQAGDSADPINALFDNPADNPSIFEQFPIDNMSLSGQINGQLEDITSVIMRFTADDIIKRRDTITNFSRSVSEALGGGSATYNAVLGLSAPKKTYKKLTVDDVYLLNNLNDVIKHLDSLAVLLDTSDGNDRQDYYRFYADYAIAQGMNFSNTNISRFFIPFPMGASLEQLATQYLGVPERWIEIAALNSLKAPYVDEDGYDIAVTASSGGDTLTVANAGSLYIGQVVRVQSNVVESTVRKVRSVDVVSSVETIVTFETSESPVALTAYKPSQGARVHASMPNTVNSDMLIAIPSTSQPTYDTTFKTSPEVDDLDSIVRASKVDLLQDSSGDWILTGGGDIKLAYGLTNLLQAAMMIINTKTNELLQNPSFGNPVDAGISVADLTAKDILRSLTKAFSRDPRFTGILAGEVTITGGTVVVSLLLGIKNTQISLPVQSEIPR